MKNLYQLPSKEQFQARKAVQQIQKWIEIKYPMIASTAKTKMIIECLIEITEERKYRAASN